MTHLEAEHERFKEVQAIRVGNPFPQVSFARQHLWGWLDHWAWRRMRRLGVPTPTQAYHQGRVDERTLMQLTKGDG